MKALVLGLERRPDRRKRVEDHLRAEVPWLSFEYFRATDGKADKIEDSEVAPSWNTSRNALYGDYEDVCAPDGTVLHKAEEFLTPGVTYDFSPGERGCAHSHLKMWQWAAEQPGPVLILEDDVQLKFKRAKGKAANGQTFTSRLELGMKEAARKKVDVLYLGWAGHRDGNYKHCKASRGKKSQVIRKAEYVWTTVAYVLWPQGAKKLLDVAKPIDQPVDNFMAWESREGRLNSYVLLDEHDTDDKWDGGVVNQFDFMGDTDIKKSDGGAQGDDPTVFLTKKTSSEKHLEAGSPQSA